MNVTSFKLLEKLLLVPILQPKSWEKPIHIMTHHKQLNFFFFQIFFNNV